MKVFINEVDNDCHTVTGTIEKDFGTLEEAQQWCRDERWSGYSYFIDREMTEAINKEPK